jgi:capsular polysaccharide biosynthesis protein
MKFNNAYSVFSLLLIPIYLFHAPVINYIHNFNNITYSLDIPENKIGDNSEKMINYRDLEISNNLPLKQIISESWVISFPDINSEKLSNDFSRSLKKIGIKSVIKVPSKDNSQLIAIGPFVDKEMAENIARKINNSLGYSGNIMRLSN